MDGLFFDSSPVPECVPPQRCPARCSPRSFGGNFDFSTTFTRLSVTEADHLPLALKVNSPDEHGERSGIPILLHDADHLNSC